MLTCRATLRNSYRPLGESQEGGKRGVGRKIYREGAGGGGGIGISGIPIFSRKCLKTALSRSALLNIQWVLSMYKFTFSVIYRRFMDFSSVPLTASLLSRTIIMPTLGLT